MIHTIDSILIIILIIIQIVNLNKLHNARKEIEEYRNVFIPLRDLLISNDYDVDDIIPLIKIGIIEKKGFVASHDEEDLWWV